VFLYTPTPNVDQCTGFFFGFTILTPIPTPNRNQYTGFIVGVQRKKASLIWFWFGFHVFIYKKTVGSISGQTHIFLCIFSVMLFGGFFVEIKYCNNGIRTCDSMLCGLFG
jgi:hypothetical protein